MKRNEGRKPKSRIICFLVDEDDFIRLDTLADQTSCSRAEVLRRCLQGARLKSTVDAQALGEVSRLHADLNRAGGLLKLAIREGVGNRSTDPRATWFLGANLPGVTTAHDVELACRLVEAVQAQNTRVGKDGTYHLVISLHPEDRSLDRNELRHVVENLVDVLGFSEHQYIAARHNDKHHEHVLVAINKIHPESFRIHSPAWDHQKLFTSGRALETELGLRPLRSRARQRDDLPQRAAEYEAQQGSRRRRSVPSRDRNALQHDSRSATLTRLSGAR